MKPALLACGLGLLAGCAVLIDVNDLRPPVEVASDAGDGATGACLPPDVTNLTTTPRGIHTAVDATDVYFVRGDPPNDSAILRCAKCGCDKPTVVVAKLNQPGGIAVDDDFIFYTDTAEAGSLTRISKTDPNDKKQIAPLESPIGVVVDATHVYWTVIGGGPLGVASAGIFRAKKDLTEVTTLATAGALPDNLIPYALAVDEKHVYYTIAPDIVENAQEPCNAAFGTIRRVTKTGGVQAGEKIAAGQPCPVAIALSDDAVYWTNLGIDALAGSVRARAKAGGAEMKIADGQGRPTSLAFHQGRLTWNVPASQRVVSCLVPECVAPMAIATEQANPSGVRADDTGIYWTVFGTVGLNFTDGALRHANP